MRIEQKQRIYLFLTMICVALVVGAIILYFSYQTSYKEKQQELIHIVQSRARIIEAVAKFDKEQSEDFKGGSFEATLSQIRDAHNNFEGFGKTGEFTLAKLENNQIIFLIRHRHATSKEILNSIPFNSKFAEPMRMALKGKSGAIVGLDYRGQTVLAAFEPVKHMNIGLVAKIDLDEIRAPFVKSGFMAGVAGILIIAIGSIIFIRVSEPLFSLIVANEARLNLAMEAYKAYLWDWDIKTDKVYFGLNWFESLGYNPKEFEHNLDAWKKLLHPDDTSKVNNVLTYHLNKKSDIYEVETRLLKKDGTYRWNLDVGKVVAWDNNGNPLRMVGMDIDISSRKLVEEELKKYREQLENLVELKSKQLEKIHLRSKSFFEMPLVGLLVFSPDKYFIEINDKACEMLGYSREELLTKSWVEITSSKDIEKVTQLFSKVYSEELNYYRLEKRCIKKDGTGLEVEEAVGCIKSPDGIPEYFVSMIQDISERKQIEFEKERMNQAREDFLSTAAHEIRTPLTSIRGYSELLINRDNLSNEMIKQFSSHINKESENMANLIDDLLDLSKIESNESFELNLELSSLIDCINHEINLFKDQKNGNSFKLEIERNPYDILIDSVKIGQVFRNLYSNSVKYGHSGCEILTKIRFEDEVVSISVSDRGKGMTQSQVDHIFDKFYRTKEVKSIQGTGLGMGIVKYLVTSHTGTIWIKSKLDVGTTVNIELPKIAPIWREEYSVKIPAIDDQHKKIFELIARLSLSIRGKDKKTDIDLILNELMRYAEFHFKYEEDLFHKYNYPDTSRHIKGHRYFQHKIDSFKFMNEEENQNLKIDIISFLYNWLTKHIREDDQAYSLFLDEKLSSELKT